MAVWLVENWFEILSAVGIVASLLFTTVSLRSETKTRRIANQLAMTANHREIWKEFFKRPELARVLDPDVLLSKQSVTAQEQEFVTLVVVHLSSVYEALKDELVVQQQGIRRDVESFFSLPIPKVVWERIRIFQNEDFVKFVDMCQGRPGL